jgi:protein-S-isoprenylcysteine O-methyltransferase Ste14
VRATDPGLARAVVLAASLALIVVPALLHRGVSIQVVESRRNLRERALLGLVALGFLSALTWAATPLLAFADYPLHPLAFAAGIGFLLLALWLLYRTHATLGPNWSATLELRQEHRLVTQGPYRRVRHPMYLALLAYGLGQTLVLPNWIAGPFYLVALALLVSSRIGPEERMMRDTFGSDYEAYRRRTKRLVPGLW